MCKENGNELRTLKKTWKFIKNELLNGFINEYGKTRGIVCKVPLIYLDL